MCRGSIARKSSRKSVRLRRNVESRRWVYSVVGGRDGDVSPRQLQVEVEVDEDLGVEVEVEMDADFDCEVDADADFEVEVEMDADLDLDVDVDLYLDLVPDLAVQCEINDEECRPSASHLVSGRTRPKRTGG